LSVHAETSVAPVSAWSAAGAQGKRPEFSKQLSDLQAENHSLGEWFQKDFIGE